MIKKFFPIYVWPLIILFAVGTVWLRLSIVDMNLTVSRLDGELKNRVRDRQELEVQLGRLRSPRQLEAIARKKFGWEAPAPHQIILMNRNKEATSYDFEERDPKK